MSVLFDLIEAVSVEARVLKQQPSRKQRAVQLPAAPAQAEEAEANVPAEMIEVREGSF